MTSFPKWAGFRPIIMLGIALALLLSPMTIGSRQALAQEALYPGAVGLVANTGGEPVLLREAPSFDAAVVSSFPEGTPADIVEGPVYSEDGAAWHGVSIGGVIGYMVAGYLVDGGQVAAPMPAEEIGEEVPAETMAAEAPAPEATTSELPANPVATADLNLRAGPTYNDMVLAIIPAGAMLTMTGEWMEGFAGVTYNGQYGWVDGAWLGSEAAPQPPVQDAVLLQEAAPEQAVPQADDAALVGDLTAPTGETAQAIDVANLRLGPSENDEVLRVLPAGATVTVTGEPSAGWLPVWYNGTWGYISADLLATDPAGTVSLAQEAVPADALAAPDDGSAEMLATTLSDVNLRTDPDMSAAVIATIPPGMALTPLAGPEGGFYQVDFNGQIGWVAAEYLEVSASYLQRGDRNDRGKVEDSEPAGNAERGGGIIWPVSGGTWSIMQGYNGSSHQNQDGLWQYYYSLDLVREDGGTAGQTVYSPVNGVVRWTDPGSGGISIDIGDGHAVAMFHVAFDGRFQAGTEVSQGEPMGQISGSGGPGFAGSPHLHFTLWTSDDNGNWDRQAEPFTGKYAISGMDFPDIGGRSQHAGTTFSP
jgi:uncharacterized protein YgiM (DUF1202 family)